MAGLVLGGMLGAAVAWAIAQRRVGSAEQRASILDNQVTRLSEELEQIRAAMSEAQREAASVTERLRVKESEYERQRQMLEEAEKKLTDTFRAAGAEALRANNEQFISLAKKAFETLMAEAKGDVEKKQQAIDSIVKPIRELLEKHHVAVHELEKKREVAYKGLEEQIKVISASHERLGTETGRLVTALRRPEQRGRWGEMQLRNVVELAGMTEHCDFREQVQTDDAATRDRPDMVVHLPGGGVIVVDSKVSLDAYLNSIDPAAERGAEMQRHARQVETHVRQLSSKGYWNQFERTPRLVVMFMPLESALYAALEVKPDLHAEAMKQHVLVATPTLLVALLRAIAYGWQQEAIAENAKEIADVGRDLYERLATFTNHLERVGKSLDAAASCYNKAIGSLESRVLPSTRRLRELGATIQSEIEAPVPIETDVREVASAELKSLPIDTTPADSKAKVQKN